MNVAGLPAILNGNDVPGDKATNAATIGSKFAQYGYDVIHVQEVCRSPQLCFQCVSAKDATFLRG